MASLIPSLWGNSANGDAPLNSLHREIDKVFEDFNRNFGLPRAWHGLGDAQAAFTPKMDIVENDNTLEVTTELPGVAEADVEVTVVDDVLTIRGEKKAEKKDETGNHHVIERSYGSFQRSLRLPFAVEPEKIEAHFKDGILKIVLPKPPETETKAHTIAIKSATP